MFINYLENRGMVSLSGCVYLLAIVVMGQLVKLACHCHQGTIQQPLYIISSSAYAICVKMNNIIHSAHTYINYTLKKLKHDIHTKLPLESYQNQI